MPLLPARAARMASRCAARLLLLPLPPLLPPLFLAGTDWATRSTMRKPFWSSLKSARITWDVDGWMEVRVCVCLSVCVCVCVGA